MVTPCFRSNRVALIIPSLTAGGSGKFLLSGKARIPSLLIRWISSVFASLSNGSDIMCWTVSTIASAFDIDCGFMAR